MMGDRCRKTKLIVITQYFYPETFRINDMCKEWVNRGYDVTVITGIPNYPQGKFYSGYGLFRKCKEHWNGVQIIRLPIISRGKSRVRLTLNYLSYVISGYFWQVFTKIEGDCIFIHEQSPLTQSLVGVWYGKRRRIPVIHYVTDLWPENVAAVSGIRSEFVMNQIGKMAEYIYRNNSKILTSTHRFIYAIKERGVLEDKLEFWPHYAEDFYERKVKNSDNIASQTIPNDGRFNIAFTGNIGTAQGLNILPKAARILQDKGIYVCFNMIGEGRGKKLLLDLAAEYHVEEFFRFIGKQLPERIPFYLAQCDVGLVILTDNPVFTMSLPTKLQSYMACGIPIIASGEGEMCDIVEQAEAGLCAQTGNPDALANCIEKFASMDDEHIRKMQINALQYYSQNFNKETLMNRMDEIITTTIMEAKVG